jgi:hypothetical protein
MKNLLIALVLSSLAAGCSTSNGAPVLQNVLVYKTPTCGCCEKWVAHMREAGFPVEVRDMDDTSEERARAGVPIELASCHTAVVDGYAVEGHVPADVVKRMLKERPEIRGIAVAGMPIGSPGMEQPGINQPYNITGFDREGKLTVFDRR